MLSITKYGKKNLAQRLLWKAHNPKKGYPTLGIPLYDDDWRTAE